MMMMVDRMEMTMGSVTLFASDDVTKRMSSLKLIQHDKLMIESVTQFESDDSMMTVTVMTAMVMTVMVTTQMGDEIMTE